MNIFKQINKNVEISANKTTREKYNRDANYLEVLFSKE